MLLRTPLSKETDVDLENCNTRNVGDKADATQNPVEQGN